MCCGRHVQKCLWGWGLWPTFSREQVGQCSQGPFHPIPRVWGPIVEGWVCGVTPGLTFWSRPPSLQALWLIPRCWGGGGGSPMASGSLSEDINKCSWLIAPVCLGPWQHVRGPVFSTFLLLWPPWSLLSPFLSSSCLSLSPSFLLYLLVGPHTLKGGQDYYYYFDYY